MKCSGVVLQCSDGLSNKVSNITRSLMDNMKLLLICILRVLLSQSNSSLISRNSKLQIYRTLVRPVVTYGSESLTLTMEDERALAVLERKVLRKIYGPVKKKKNYGEFDETMN